MNLLGRVAQRQLPDVVGRWMLMRLSLDAAAALGRPRPRLGGLTSQQLLECFAAESAAAARDSTTPGPTYERLFAVTYGYGKWLRRAFLIASTQEAMIVARAVYRVLGIDFEGNPAGDIVIASCFFSCLYTPEVCRLMSALDAGLLAGLSGGGRLEFSRRITEGSPCCRAQLVIP